MAEEEPLDDNDEVDPEVARLAHRIGDEHDADVILYSGPIEADAADSVIRLTKSSSRRKNVFFLLTTRGGSPDAAFRMARSLQSHYSKFILYIHGMCKSAGTLIAVGAHEIILSDFGEFGPLDVQLEKKDELFENASGLDISQALTSLNTRTLAFFRTALIDIRTGSQGQISTKLASEIASKLAVGVYGHIYSQIDPNQLGSNERAVRIAHEYASRLTTSNLHAGAIERLVASYPSHGFVIDLIEAKKLFKNVRPPSELEEQLGECISFVTRDEPYTDNVLDLLNRKGPPDDKESNTGIGAAGDGAGSGENHEAPDSPGDLIHQRSPLNIPPIQPQADLPPS